MPVKWIPESAARAIHAELLTEFGGPLGRVDDSLLGATLARPRQCEAYGNPGPDLASLAAAYGFGFARNHVFTDGNKRMALTCIDVFLGMNGQELTAGEVEAVEMINQLAAGNISEEELSAWIRGNMEALR